jgi:hypothetical protein
MMCVIEIGGMEMTDIEAQGLKRLLVEARARYSDEEIIEQGGVLLLSDEDPCDWAREIVRDLDEKLP